MGDRILVVDDEHQALRMISDILTPMGYEVLALSDSRMAADQINRQKFDAAFVDVRMPHLDGFELTHRIRTSRSNSFIPIVLMTGYDEVEAMRRGFQVGITFFLHKPFNPEKLRGLLGAMRSMILQERRRYARLPLNAPVKVTSGNKTWQLQSSNLSQAGMLLESASELEVGQEVQIEFSVPENPRTLRARAKVVRKDSSGRAALSLLNMAEDDREAVMTYISGVVRA